MSCENCCEAFVGTYEGYYVSKDDKTMRVCTCCKNEYVMMGWIGIKVPEEDEEKCDEETLKPVIGACGDCAKWFDEGKDFCKCCGFDLNSYNQPEEEEEEEEDCICESDENPNPLCPDHQCCWACSTQSVPITLNEHSRLWLCDKCNDKGDWCRGCHKLIDEDGMCSPGCDYYQWGGVWTCHRCDTERCDEPYCKKCCHPDDIAVYASEYAERCAICN
jgi:hypothetical protein